MKVAISKHHLNVVLYVEFEVFVAIPSLLHSVLFSISFYIGNSSKKSAVL